MLNTIKEVKERCGSPLTAICRTAGLPRSTLARWQRRSAAGLPPVGTPGPVKPGPIDWSRIEEEARALEHRRRRSLGSGEFHGRWSGVIARRPLQRLVEKARREAMAKDSDAAVSVEWLNPGLIWGMDPTEFVFGGEKVWFHTVRDIPSRFTFARLLDRAPTGAVIAKFLDELMTSHGAPLFLRFDNAANENCKEVIAVLNKHGVIPFNSPPYYPKYNGGTEKAQYELQRSLAVRSADVIVVQPEHRPAYATLALHDMNHLPRRVLGGQTACHAFCSRDRRAIITKWERREVADELLLILGAVLDDDKTNAKTAKQAWRIAIKTWLESHEFIKLKTKVSPNYQPENVPLSA